MINSSIEVCGLWTSESEVPGEHVFFEGGGMIHWGGGGEKLANVGLDAGEGGVFVCHLGSVAEGGG